jgi:ribosome-associated protein
MEKQGVFARRKEGMTEGRWIAVDYFDVIVHIFQEESRKFYQLEKLWINENNVTKYED